MEDEEKGPATLSLPGAWRRGWVSISKDSRIQLNAAFVIKEWDICIKEKPDITTWSDPAQDGSLDCSPKIPSAPEKFRGHLELDRFV